MNIIFSMRKQDSRVLPNDQISILYIFTTKIGHSTVRWSISLARILKINKNKKNGLPKYTVHTHTDYGLAAQSRFASSEQYKQSSEAVISGAEEEEKGSLGVSESLNRYSFKLYFNKIPNDAKMSYEFGRKENFFLWLRESAWSRRPRPGDSKQQQR